MTIPDTMCMYGWLRAASLLACLLMAPTDGNGIIDNMLQFGMFELSWIPFNSTGESNVFPNPPNSTTRVQGGVAIDTGQHITHGHNARRNQYPFIAVVLLEFRNSLFFICAGVIVNQHSVVTAAHCLDYISYYDYYVAVGIYDISQGINNPGSKVIKVTSHKIHGAYDVTEPGYPNDIAILHTHCRIVYNDYVKPAALATRYDGRFVDADCYLVGWGYSEFGFPTILQEAHVYAISNYVCHQFWSVNPRARVLNSHICNFKKPISASSGDSGGPMICRGKVAGLLSWGLRSSDGCIPGVNTRVSYYRRWILSASKLQ